MTSFDYIQCEEFYMPCGFAQFIDPDQRMIEEEMARQKHMKDIQDAEKEF